MKFTKPLTASLMTIALATTLLASSAFAAEHEVKMLNNGEGGIMVFEPGSLKVEVGDTVKFLPTDMGHNSTSYSTPEGAETWKGDMSKEVTVKFEKEGIYIYKCDPHVVMAMVGVIQVGEAKNKEAAEKSAKELTATFSLNKDRLDKYLASLSEEKK